MYNICCLLFKDSKRSQKFNKVNCQYDQNWVITLYNMVSRNITKPFNFFCLTDQHIENQNINQIMLQTDKPSTYDKLYFFKEGVLPNLPTIYFDLDVVIINNIEKLFEYSGLRMVHKLARDFEAGHYAPHNGSVIKWQPSKVHKLYERYAATPKEDLPGTDDDFLYLNGAPHPFSVKDCVCYTAQRDNLLWWDKPYKLNKENTVVCFNKHASKQDVFQEESPWIKDYWY